MVAGRIKTYSFCADRSFERSWGHRGGFGHQLPPRGRNNRPLILSIVALGSGFYDLIGVLYIFQVMINFLKDFEDKLGITITCSQETEPLGTAGPLALARDKLADGSGEPFFVLNSDVISEYPFAELIKFHKCHGGEATIMVTKVNPFWTFSYGISPYM
jgi:hypothetical protein